MNSSCLISLGDRGASPSPCNTLDPATAVGIGSIPCTADIAAVASNVEREGTCEEARLSLCCSLVLVEGCISGRGSNVAWCPSLLLTPPPLLPLHMDRQSFNIACCKLRIYVHVIVAAPLALGCCGLSTLRPVPLETRL